MTALVEYPPGCTEKKIYQLLGCIPLRPIAGKGKSLLLNSSKKGELTHKKTKNFIKFDTWKH